MITKRRKRKFNALFFLKWASYRLYRKRPPRIVNRTVPKIIVISVYTVNRFPLNIYEGESQSHAPAHVLMRLYPINKSFVFLQTKEGRHVRIWILFQVVQWFQRKRLLQIFFIRFCDKLCGCGHLSLHYWHMKNILWWSLCTFCKFMLCS